MDQLLPCLKNIHKLSNSYIFTKLFTLLTYFPSCHRQLGQQQILSISGGLEPVSVRFPMNVPWLSPLPQQYVSMSSLDARVFCIPLVSVRLLLLGWSLDFCLIYGLSISSVYVQLSFLYFLAGIRRKGPYLKLFEARRSLQLIEDVLCERMIILICPFLSCASIPTHIEESKGRSFYTILILCVSCIFVISTRGLAS